MVVIRNSRSYLESRYGKDFVKEIREFAKIIGFTVEESDEIKIEFNPDRPDLFSFPMLEQAISVYNRNVAADIPDYEMVREQIEVDPHTKAIRKVIGGFYAAGPAIGKNLEDLIDYQEKLHLSIGRDRRKISIGIHDMDKISPPFSFRLVKSDEIVFETYDSLVTGTAAEILEKHPKAREYGYLIRDRNRVPVLMDSLGQILSMPPVINGKTSVVTDNTSKFFVDITGSDRSSIRSAMYCLSYMFHYLGYSVRIMAENEKVERFLGSLNGRNIRITEKEVERTIGKHISSNQISEILNKMGYSVSVGREIDVSVPGNRIDVMGASDVIEDLAKGFRYDLIESSKPSLSVIGKELRERKGQRDLRELLIGQGFQEIMSYVVTSSKIYEATSYRGGVSVRNPKSLDFSIIRDRLYLNMLDFLRLNRSNSLPQRVFEIGDVILNGDQKSNVAIGIISSKASYSEIYSTVRYILSRLYSEPLRIEPMESQHLISGRSGSIILGNREIGVIGEVNPETLVRFELQNPVVIAEFSFP